MGIFATRVSRSTPSALPGSRADLSSSQRAALPPGFEAVGEALASGGSAVDACAVVGQLLALDGVTLGEALGGLGAASRLVRGDEPAFAESRALAEAWSEAMLGYLHQLSCEDPATGLASLAHLQSRLSELYRGQVREGSPLETHALVVADIERGDQVAPVPGPQALAADLRTAGMADVVRTVFHGSETMARIGRERMVVLARREEQLVQRVALLRRMLEAGDGGGDARVWVEGLAPTLEGAAATLSELARA